MPDRTLRAPLPRTAVHLCVDMQNIFAPGGPWAAPWMARVAPVVQALAERFPERTVFTRFITPRRPEDMPGAWRRYYQKRRQTARDVIDPELLDLLPALKRLVPPAAVIDKGRYSAFAGHDALLTVSRRRCAEQIETADAETVLGAWER